MKKEKHRKYVQLLEEDENIDAASVKLMLEMDHQEDIDELRADLFGI